jgi:hypothetical protein
LVKVPFRISGTVKLFFCPFSLSKILKLATAASFHSLVNLIIILSSYIPLNAAAHSLLKRSKKLKTLTEFVSLGRVLPM